MSLITIDKNELEDLKKQFGNLAGRREEHNDKLNDILVNLRNVKSGGLVEEIVEKLEIHIEDVNKNQLGNVIYTSDFLKLLIENFTEIDENTKL